MGSLSLVRDHSSFTRMIWISWSAGSCLKEGVSIDSAEGQADPELRLREAGREALESAAFQSEEKRSVGSEARAGGERKKGISFSPEASLTPQKTLRSVLIFQIFQS
ncbi:MAG: hypothetical protein EGQ34_03060 [Sutterella sp.]|nr:hypothetical protein [Sutterella sp.]